MAVAGRVCSVRWNDGYGSARGKNVSDSAGNQRKRNQAVAVLTAGSVGRRRIGLDPEKTRRYECEMFLGRFM